MGYEKKLTHFKNAIEEDIELLSEAIKYHGLIWKKIEPFTGGRILEIGSGRGNFACQLQKKEFFILSDYNSGFISRLREKLGNITNKEIMYLDAEDISSDEIEYLRTKRIDTIICVHVIEHIYDDIICVKNLSRALNPGGKIIIIGPAYNFLFSSLDREYGHYRRYNSKSMNNLAKKTGLLISHLSYFNFLGIFGWFFLHKLFKKKRLSHASLIIFQTILPLARFLDALFFKSIGLSVLAVFVKTDDELLIISK